MAHKTKVRTLKGRTKKPAKDWRLVFLEELSKTGNVSAAAKRAKVARNTAYLARGMEGKDEAGQIEAQRFAAAWDEALEVAIEMLELEARRRAEQGTLEPVFYQGEICGRVKKYSDTLLIFLLKAHRPEKYRDNVRSEITGPDGAAPEIVLRIVRDAQKPGADDSPSDAPPEAN